MKQLLMGVITASLLLVAVALSNNPTKNASPTPGTGNDLQVVSESRNPWTNLRLNNDPAEFRFAIVSDRTGGHRPKIFSKAVDQLNLLQPEFVISVGDLIEGYKEDPVKVGNEWREFQGYVSKLQMPFFYVPGNHDLANTYLGKVWEEKFGRSHYHFVYRGVLFLMLNTDDPPGVKEGKISPEQVKYVKKVLDENCCPRWTVVSLHRPLWADGDPEKNGWLDVEKLLEGRSYTVFAGHIHRYKKFVRNGQNYYQLATTGGGSKMRGVRYGEFDHITWVTMKKEGPVLANVLLDGIYPEDMRKIDSDEEGVPTNNQKPVYLVKGKVHMDGCPLTTGSVVFHLIQPDGKKTAKTGDAMLEADGTFTMSTYTAFDGAPAGDYIITLTGGGAQVPVRYTKVDTSDLRTTVKSGTNDLTLELVK